MAQRAEAAGRSILARAEKKDAEMLALLDRTRPGIEAALDAAQQRYTDMENECGQLKVVMARAREAQGALRARKTLAVTFSDETA